jgi:hypothetical protein
MTAPQIGPLEIGPDTLAHAPESLTRDELGAATSALATALLAARTELARADQRQDAEGARHWATEAERLERAHAWLFRLFCRTA